jgi:eukaryotic-like serine/threonine-protein kinase
MPSNQEMFFGRYKILRKLASGGMAEVFLARHESVAGFARNVVVKKILPELCSDPMFVESFVNEAKLAAQLNHPNVVQISDLGQVGESFFIAMEYIKGCDLSAIVRRASKHKEFIPLRVALTILVDICNGLDFAHRACDLEGHPLGIVHRDATPSNVLVSVEGPSKIVDFGIAKATARSENKTKTGSVKGKTSYFAPEQILGTELDRRVDVFACGIMAYELFTNVNPFRAETEYTSMERILRFEPQPLAYYRGDIAETFDTIIRRALAKEADARYGSCGEFRLALEQAGEQLGVSPSHAVVRAYLAEHRETLLTQAHDAALDPVSGGSAVSQTINISATRVPKVEADADIVPLAREPLPAYVRLSLAFVVLALAAVSLILWRTSTKQPIPVASSAATEYGLDIRTVPDGATVSLDGVLRSGSTPLHLEILTPGRHQIHIERAAFMPTDIDVVVEHPGTRDLVVTMTPTNAPAAPPPPMQSAPKPKAPRALDAARNEPARSGEGNAQVRFFVEPWATVEVDGKVIGDTPLESQTLSAGTHVVVLRNAELGKTVTRKIRLRAGQEIVVRENFLGPVSH